MKNVGLFTLFLVLFFQNAAFSSKNKSGHNHVIQAARTTESISIDGYLDEKVWQREGMTAFFQTDPDEGMPATEKTEVWVAYDDKAIYIAAFSYDSEPEKIIGRLGRRDASADSDWFMFCVDPYFDRRSGYVFAVNPANSIRDAVLSNDVNWDYSWDGVWESKARINDSGWTVEMRIPFDQLRFPVKDKYVWGVNFRRVIKRKNETAETAWVSKNESGFVSFFARMEGIENIASGRRIEILPYITSQGKFNPAEPGNPFNTGRQFLGNTGLDIKVGLKSNLTLDMAINPDFGQVEVDPAVINLSAFETFYQERRPFFIEGASIFNNFGRGGFKLNAGMGWPSPRLFYSRRIGRSPQGRVEGEGYTDYPANTKILGAAKITGRIGEWNVGIINAVTGREYAELDFNGLRSREEVEPPAYFNVIRAQKDINQGRHGIGFMATGVLRGIDNDNLGRIMNNNAYTFAVDGWHFFDEDQNYIFGGWAGGTYMEGSPENILRIQRSALHYYQRPDADHVKLDPNAVSMSGWGGQLQFAKQNAPFLLLLSAGVLSPGFNPNELGFQSGGSDVVNLSFISGHMWTKPGKIFHQLLAAGGGLRNYDFGGNKISEAGLFVFQGILRNFWQFNIELVGFPETLNNRLTRGGPMALSAAGFESSYSLSTDSRKSFVIEGNGGYWDSGSDGYGWNMRIGMRVKPADNLNFSIAPHYRKNLNQNQWIGAFKDHLMHSTYGMRYVFGQIEQQIISMDIRLDWIFSPKISLQAYLQPFIGTGSYNHFKELAAPKSRDYHYYGNNGSKIVFEDGVYRIDPDGEGTAEAFSFSNPDFNLKSLRGTVVLRWEYMPGSQIYFVWTQNRSDYANSGDFSFRRDINDLFSATGDNIFMIKATYYLNI